jgi:ABC-type uncharacterized transport system substrate-binding protein
MKKKVIVRTLCTLLFALCVPVAAQPATKVPQIGYLSATSAPEASARTEAFRQGLRELGYIEGKNIAFVYRTTGGKSGLNAELAAELVRLKVDIIVTDITGLALAAKKATKTIPIVMTTSTDPVGTGLVASLARPGGNITGLTNVGAELGGKHLELLKEAAPRLARVAVLSTKSAAGDAFLKETKFPAEALGIQLLSVLIQGPNDFEGAFRTIAKDGINALVNRLQPNAYSAHYKRVAKLAARNRLPSISAVRTWTDAGGLMSYGSILTPSTAALPCTWTES